MNTVSRFPYLIKSLPYGYIDFISIYILIKLDILVECV